MSTEPNIFQFASKELSQDAFICWLLSYAEKKYENNPLNKIANSLIKKFTKEQIEVEKIEVELQKYHIDILVTINQNIHIIIEDKISCPEHNNQLDKYKKAAQEHYKGGENFFVYLKTGEMTPAEKKSLERKNWKPVDRETFLGVLKSGSEIDNAIYKNYYEYISNLNSKYEFEKIPFCQWGAFNWMGFFSRLSEVFHDSNWGYVPNPSGGFMGFWWNQIEVYNKNNTTAYLYMLLGGNQLSYNVNVDNKTQQSLIRNTCYEIMNELFEASRPKKFGKGKNMAFAHHKDDIWVCDENGFLKFEEVCENLKQATSALSEKKDEFIKCLEKHLCNETEQ